MSLRFPKQFEEAIADLEEGAFVEVGEGCRLYRMPDVTVTRSELRNAQGTPLADFIGREPLAVPVEELSIAAPEADDTAVLCPGCKQEVSSVFDHECPGKDALLESGEVVFSKRSGYWAQAEAFWEQFSENELLDWDVWSRAWHELSEDEQGIVADLRGLMCDFFGGEDE